jgi:hypothetical protein
VADEAATRVTETDVRALAAKLKGLHSLLTPAEAALLQAVLRRAAGGLQPPAAGSSDWAVPFNPFPYLDAVASEEARERPGPAPDAPTGAGGGGAAPPPT